MKLPILAFIIAAVLTTIFTPLVKRLAERYGAVAVPRERDVHKSAIPRWGGISMFAAFVITLVGVYLWLTYFTGGHFVFNHHALNQFIGVLIGATIVAVVGAVDDKIELSPLIQTASLVGAAVVLILFGVRVEGITNPFATGLTPAKHYLPHYWIAFSPWLSYLITVVWVFLVAKTVDFMDGLDGLAAGICGISGITIALMGAQAGQYGVSVIAATLAGVCTGFLRDNYNPASIIMGTVGAQFLGFVLAAVAIVGTFKIAATVSVALPLIVLGVPIFDGLRVVLTRTIERRPAYLPDRSTHLHHILINRGLSTKQAVGVIWGICAACCAVALLMYHFSGVK
jgi:UDP-GlcNAc:undecaprenyl-phosphate GlcNAc-1-phosphate transferase